MAAKRFNLSIEQGATFKKRWIWRDKNGRPYKLASWTAILQLRATASSPTVVYELSTANGRIALSNSGVIQLTIPSDDTLTITSPGVYDLLLVAPDETTEVRLIEGKFTTSPGVTKN